MRVHYRYDKGNAYAVISEQRQSRERKEETKQKNKKLKKISAAHIGYSKEAHITKLQSTLCFYSLDCTK